MTVHTLCWWTLIGFIHVHVDNASYLDPSGVPLLLEEDHKNDDDDSQTVLSMMDLMQGPINKLTENKIPDDCWRNILEFTSTLKDLTNFRWISTRHLEVYKDYLTEVGRTDHVLRFVSQHEIQYPPLKMLSSAVLFPTEEVDLSYNQFINFLRHFSEHMKQFAVRGRHPLSKHDFVSIALQSGPPHGQAGPFIAWLMLSFDEFGLNSTRMYTDWPNEVYDETGLSVINFDEYTLCELLAQGTWFQDVLEWGHGPAWSIRRWPQKEVSVWPYVVLFVSIVQVALVVLIVSKP